MEGVCYHMSRALLRIENQFFDCCRSKNRQEERGRQEAVIAKSAQDVLQHHLVAFHPELPLCECTTQLDHPFGKVAFQQGF